MKRDLEKSLIYWRASLADGALGRGRFKQRDRKDFIELSKEVLANGILPKNQVAKVFEGQKPDIKTMPVQLWPMVTARKVSHGATILSGYPELVAPVVTEAMVDRDGNIRPSRNVIARDLLKPLPNDEFSLGNLDDFDAFLAASPFSPDENSPIWAQYLEHCRAMLDAVSPGWPAGDDNYVSARVGFMEVASDAAATIAQIIGLYDALIDDPPEAPLLKRTAAPSQTTKELSPDVEAALANRLGHASDAFPLADHQRQVLSYVATGKTGDVVAVNGPPGTGKTTLLLSVIADAWVRAALLGAEPPVIVAASTNNQAVTNIIDAFGKDFAEGDGPFAGRWLPDLKSYGLYLPSKTKEAEAARTYQTERFFEELESYDYLAKAKAAFLKAGRAAFPDNADANPEEIVAALHQRIVQDIGKLSVTDKARTRVMTATARVHELLGDDPASAVLELENSASESCANQERHASWESGWTKHQADESFWLSLLSFLPAVARKRLAKARAALDDIGCTNDTVGLGSVSEIAPMLQDGLRSATAAAKTAETAYRTAQTATKDLNEVEQEWTQAVEDLGAPNVSASDTLELDRFADCNVRFHLFQLACHYWEGRWLLEMEEDLDDIVGSRRKTGRKTVEPRWRRRMMLTPCAVSTFASLCGKMSFGLKSSGDWKTGYLYDFIDLLIVDEAGQVLPEVAAPSFALAKRALVIGDTQQIEPIASVSNAVDIGNLQSAGFLQDSYSDGELSELSHTGLRSVGGSVMQLAQQACLYEPYPDLERGLYLFEHRRCYDEIISFCNTLCYKGSLKPIRGAAPTDLVTPSMGYLHIDGLSLSFGGSRANPTEASTIADWLASYRDDLEQQYGTKLEDIVGVVTPFGRQVQEIKRACADRGIDVQQMTIGTVHSLQGAERQVVIFSPVYSKHADGQFIDMSPSMLNVTVSRAKDSFLVFGDMDVFSSAAKGAPRSVLADVLFSSKGTALDFAPQPRADLQSANQPLTTLRDAEEHDRYMIDALSSSARDFTIVSPWVIARTMERVGLLDAFQKATARGASIDVFVDPLLNQTTDTSGAAQLETAKAALSKVGVSTHEVRQLHSKIFIVGTDQLCIGSYNWLSADRHGQYARHETDQPHLSGPI
ncbi:AAA domain-containing protein [uncultured Roseobacter sp.]|uniref:AAA domain-containing protein n=1 Tax=uncultured Roseobacter sp. TaxID=114847 RepID=UPI00260D8275|nr:AAA domain-containing protein [uncultured Roseobacter sp.]